MQEALKDQENPPRLRAGLYVDGFNIYHPLKEAGEPFLKWLNLWRLGEIIIPSRSETLALVRYFSAKRPDRGGSRDRHNTYINALRAVGVHYVPGHYVAEPIRCGYCGDHSERPIEKQTDINMALRILTDAQDGLVDHVYMLTADSDHAATARVLKERVPGVKLTSVAPPNRPVSSKIMGFADARINLTRLHIERSVLPPFVRGKTGFIRRPRDYDPPEGWVHPDKQP